MIYSPKFSETGVVFDVLLVLDWFDSTSLADDVAVLFSVVLGGFFLDAEFLGSGQNEELLFGFLVLQVKNHHIIVRLGTSRLQNMISKILL